MPLIEAQKMVHGFAPWFSRRCTGQVRPTRNEPFGRIFAIARRYFSTRGECIGVWPGPPWLAQRPPPGHRSEPLRTLCVIKQRPHTLHDARILIAKQPVLSISGRDLESEPGPVQRDACRRRRTENDSAQHLIDQPTSALHLCRGEGQRHRVQDSLGAGTGRIGCPVFGQRHECGRGFRASAVDLVGHVDAFIGKARMVFLQVLTQRVVSPAFEHQEGRQRAGNRRLRG